MMLHRESALLAISLEDRSLEIVDIITRKIVRKFFDIHNGNIGCQIFNESRGWCIKFASGLYYQNRHSSKSIRVIKLSFCQKDPPMGESFWQKDS